MSWTKKQITNLLSRGSNFKLFSKDEHALERECFRIDSGGRISKTPHPQNLGSALTNPYISTDFSESQLEFITPIYTSEEGALKFLTDIHHFTLNNIKGESLWPLSTPAKLPKEKDIPIAQYGTSNIAKEKTKYRIGLRERYGSIMQTISGIHYNFSFPDELWQKLYKKFSQKGQSLQDFKTEGYFRLMRNFLEISWLDSYLFGASPALDKSYAHRGFWYFKKHKKDTYYGKYATSLRMSKYGYCCQERAVSFKNVETYIRDLRKLITTPKRKYFKLDGLNSNVLQIPNEYYAVVRPKRNHKATECLLDVLEDKGVQYVEIRSVDIDHLSPNGIGIEHLRFLHTLMLYCLMKDDKALTEKLQHINTQNHEQVALYGRKPGLELIHDNKKVTLIKWGSEIIEGMQKAAELLDKNYKDSRYAKNLEKQLEKLQDPRLTPSAQILRALIKKDQSYIDYGLKLAKKHYTHLKKLKTSKEQMERFKKSAALSHKEQEKIEAIDLQTTKGYEDLERSTQILIKAALKRNIDVEVLDAKASFIRLKKGNKVEYVKQATKTSKDSYMTYLIMEDKEVSKIVLRENNINVPQGYLFSSIEEAIENYPKDKKIVVKPTTTNFGIAVSIINKGDKKSYIKAINKAFAHSQSVIVEEFIEGTEYRVIVINYKYTAVTKRLPANVVGDGKHTIKQLIELKNTNYKDNKNKIEYPIRITDVELKKLKSQKLSLTSKPKKGRRIFLRDNTNVSTGGDAIDLTSSFPQKFKNIAIKAAKTVNAKFCGVDMIVKGDDYSIIEINFNPAIAMHVFPSEGESQDLPKYVLDTLGF